MVVPFQMVMFTLSKTADTLKLNTPWNICIIYLGFGAGLAAMFTGFMKRSHGDRGGRHDRWRNHPDLAQIVFPHPGNLTMISTAILETMWV